MIDTTKVNINNLIKMANQISDNICHQSADELRAKKVVNHMQLFWAKKMKQNIFQYYQTDGSELSDITKMAVAQLIPISH